MLEIPAEKATVVPAYLKMSIALAILAGMVLLSVNVDVPETDRADRVKRFAQRHELTFPILLDRGNVGWTYGARRIPYVVVVGADGRITAVHQGAGDYHALAESVREALAAAG